jgi:phosphate transport system substrate-binding protein
MKTNVCNKRSGSKRKTLWSCLNLILAGVVAAGCSAGKTDKIVIRGSNTIGEELAPRLIVEFKKEHPLVDFDTEFKGTSYGLGALMVGKCDIAAASREVTTNERALSPDMNMEFKDYVIGSYSVVVVVNAGNAVANLTQEQVRDIFTGVVENWKEVGGPDAPIHLYIRNPISGTYLGFQELAMEKKPYGVHLKTFTNYIGIVQAVAQDVNGIGYANLDLARQTGAKALSIGGVAPVATSVNQGKYPYARVLRLYSNKAVEASDASEFAKFVQSSRGQEIVSELGFVPHP